LDPRTYWTDRFARQGKLYVAQGGRQKIFDEQMKWVPPFLRANVFGRRVLDFGCGPGRFRKVLMEAGREYVGVDLIPDLGTEPLGESLPQGFDTAVTVMVLQHITDDADYTHWCSELYACLNPGGRLLVIDHLQQSGMESHMRPRGMKAIKATAPWAQMEQLGEHSGHWIGLFLK
jgi:2-polyprenyl-3-methyl-5-hydroxy-6-metoxy-1,4-benzoquinol methylase